MAEHFRKSSLHQAGLIIHFGHSGRPCADFRGNSLSTNTITERLYGPLPDLPISPNDSGIFSVNDTSANVPHASTCDEIPMEEVDDEVGDVWEDADPRWGSGNTRVLLIGHTNGFHIHTVCFCRCSGHRADWQQMLSSRIWPATFGRPRTGFTLECLRDFRYNNAVSKESANAYHSKLQKQTGQGVVVQCPVCDVFLLTTLLLHKSLLRDAIMSFGGLFGRKVVFGNFYILDS